MEEADLLADEVAIMRKGELAAFGSPLQLKTEHGSALQFSLLVPKEAVNETNDLILKYFADAAEWVVVDPGEAGNVVVNVQKISRNDGDEGVGVDLLSGFVTWLEGDDSAVTEYGFSNSSLEEVFLKVTGEGKEHEANALDVSNQGCCCCPNSGCCFKLSCCSKREEATNPADADVEDIRPEDSQEVNASNIATFQPKLEVKSQVKTLFLDFWQRTWTGKGSIGSYIMFGLLLLACIITGLSTANSYSPIYGFCVPAITLSLLLLSVVGPVYSDRQEGLFYLMRTQGMLSNSYLISTSVYALSIAFVYGFLTLTLLFATPLFRDTYICPVGASWYECSWEFGNPRTVENPWGLNRLGFFQEEYMEEPVELYAIRESGGYGMIFGLIFFFAISFPGAAMLSSYLPGYRFPMIMLSCILLFVGILPLVQLLAPMSDEASVNCLNMTDPDQFCSTSTFNSSAVDEDFLNCVGYEINQDIASFCVPPVAAILPQFGLFQGLSMAYTSEVRFLSVPPEFVSEVLMPSIKGGRCSGDRCQFPDAKRLYGLNLVYMLVGSMILLVLGYVAASILAFPSGRILRLRHAIIHSLSYLRCPTKTRETKSDSKAEEEEEFEEVVKEREVVRGLFVPLLSDPGPDAMEDGKNDDSTPVLDLSNVVRDELSPVLVNKLRKVYPALGGRPPKVALDSLDLHVPKGEVLGFLGKNGAGKTTALKILAGAHDPTGGVGLVAGYDCAVERISVFERLGNCPQFDVVWQTRSVQRHLEFFARLKGLPGDKVKSAAKSIAEAVGLGSPEVYRRNAGALSGGMRRRLSIAMSLLGSPAVLVLDEPTTG
jgi:ABC-type multidrug transport system ATPase subunit